MTAMFKMLKNIIFTIVIMGAFSLITIAQNNNDKKNQPPKEKPPTVSPKEKEKPKDPPPTNKPDQGNKPKKPEGEVSGNILKWFE